MRENGAATRGRSRAAVAREPERVARSDPLLYNWDLIRWISGIYSVAMCSGGDPPTHISTPPPPTSRRDGFDEPRNKMAEVIEGTFW